MGKEEFLSGWRKEKCRLEEAGGQKTCETGHGCEARASLARVCIDAFISLCLGASKTIYAFRSGCKIEIRDQPGHPERVVSETPGAARFPRGRCHRAGTIGVARAET